MDLSKLSFESRNFARFIAYLCVELQWDTNDVLYCCSEPWHYQEEYELFLKWSEDSSDPYWCESSPDPY